MNIQITISLLIAAVLQFTKSGAQQHTTQIEMLILRTQHLSQIEGFERSILSGITKGLDAYSFDDNDNNIDLCLDESGIPILLQVNEKVAIDPRGDKNPETKVAIKSRW
jgi:hypothetical protein